MDDFHGRRRIYLMRHGHVDYFDPDITDPRVVPLTEEGRAQAAAARDALQHIAFDTVISSGLPRTNETAEIVVSRHEKTHKINHLEGLEELKSGWIKAASREELAARLAYSFDGAHLDEARFMEDGELFADAERRISRSLENLLHTGDWKTALVVAHEGVNRIILGWVSGGGLSTISAFDQDLCCVNVIDVDITPAESGNGLQIERAMIKAMNITPYDYLKNGLSRSSLEHLFEIDFGISRPPLRDLQK